MDFSLRPVAFLDLPGWRDDDPTPLFGAMRACLGQITTIKPYRIGSLGIEATELAGIFAMAGQTDARSPQEARAFFEEYFQPARIVRHDGKPGFVTAFYEPEVDVSDKPDGEWRYPFYSRPDDLVDIDDATRPEELDSTYMFARRMEDGSLVPYADRSEIDQGFLEGRGLEIAWARSRIDVFFAHVQGAARLRFPNGTVKRITYAAKAGHAFSAIGKLLVERGEIPLSEISMGSIRAWLGSHPDAASEVLWHNRSYIFFREAEVLDDSLGPMAAAKVPLVAGRSLAVDRHIHTFSTPFYIHSESLRHLDDGRPFQRLMMALDTGTAIVGPSRGDIFTGSGVRAGDLAGNVRNDADFTILVPKGAIGRLI